MSLGYVFTSKDHIRPYLEDAKEGPSVQWAKAQGTFNTEYYRVAHVIQYWMRF
jgi:hypothetical protein